MRNLNNFKDIIKIKKNYFFIKKIFNNFFFRLSLKNLKSAFYSS